MLKAVTVVAAMVGLSVAGAAPISENLKTKLKNDLQTISNILEVNYAPFEWKKRHLNWDLQSELEKSRAQVDAAESVRDYRQAVVSLLNSTADYHVGFSFAATEKALLPFSVKTVQGRSIIVHVDRKKLSEKAFPVQVGDELLAMDGIAISEVKKSLLEVVGNNVPTTDEALTDLYLTRRSARGNNAVPSGTVMVTTKSKISDKERTTQLFWERTPESIPGFEFRGESSLVRNIFTKIQLPQMVSLRTQDLKMIDNPYGIGLKKSFLPDFGERLWSAPEASTMDAYIYQNSEGKKIGVIRIADYTPTSENSALMHFKSIIRKFEAETDALVIDQLNNPGGSVFYLYSLVSYLSDRPMQTPRHRFKLSPELVKEALELLSALKDIKDEASAIGTIGPSFGGYPVTYQLVVAVREYAQFIIEQWEKKNYLTEPTWIYGVDAINPSPDTNYTKPILVLVNELDFSGGDFFPAILQDNKRATIVGTRTAGAGGYVYQVTVPNVFGLESFSYTASIAERVDSNPLENLGVTPDVPLEMTVDDLRDGFKDYRSQVERVLKERLQ